MTERRQMSAGWGGQTSAPEYLCDDGARKLSPAHGALLDQAVAKARAHPEGEGFAYDGQTCARVNLHAGENRDIPRWAVDVGGTFIAGGMLEPPQPVVVTERRVFEHRLPDQHIWR